MPWQTWGAFREGRPIQAHIGGELIDLVLEFLPMRKLNYSIKAIEHVSRGMEYGSRGDDQKAIEEYERAIAIDPSIVEAYNNLANAYRRQGDSERAIPLLEKAVSIDPEYATAHFNLGAAYVDVERDGDGIEHLLKAIELGLETAEAYGDLGKPLLWLRELEHAEAAFKCSLEMEDDPEVQKNLYLVLMAQKKEKEARNWERGIPKDELEDLRTKGTLMSGISLIEEMVAKSEARRRQRDL